MSKFSNPRQKYSTEKKPPKKPVNFRLDAEYFDQVYDIASGDLTQWWTDAVTEKLERDYDINEEIKRRIG